MKKIVLLSIIFTVIVVLYLISTYENKSTITSADHAIVLLKKKFPEYNNYPSDNLPIKRVEILEMYEGWRIGMYIEGSGLPGILKANCFLVTKDGVVKETGLFQGEGPAKSINLITCTPKE